VKILRDESGQTLIFVALSMTVMLGVVAMATDVGTLFHDRRSLQIAADSARQPRTA
jgi:Flp pilus assembly protein TadG